VGSARNPREREIDQQAAIDGDMLGVHIQQPQQPGEALGIGGVAD
jgi:hypothetical protein